MSGLQGANLVEVLLQLFTRTDTDCDAVLSKEELARVESILEAHPKSTARFLWKYLEAGIDSTDGCVYKDKWVRYAECCGKVDCPESIMSDFVEIVEELPLPQGNQSPAGTADKRVRQGLLNLFRRLDAACTGSVLASELKAVLRSVGGEATSMHIISSLEEKIDAEVVQEDSLLSDSWQRLVAEVDMSGASADCLQVLVAAFWGTVAPAPARPLEPLESPCQATASFALAEAPSECAPQAVDVSQQQEEQASTNLKLAELMMRLYDKIDTDEDNFVSNQEMAMATTALKQHPSGAGNLLASFLESAAGPVEDGHLPRHALENYLGLLTLKLTPDVEQAFEDIVASYGEQASSLPKALEPVFLHLWEKVTGRAVSSRTALPSSTLSTIVQEIRAAGEAGMVLAWHLGQAPFFSQEIVTFEAYCSCLQPYSFPEGVRRDFDAIVSQLDMQRVLAGPDLMVATPSTKGQEPVYLQVGVPLAFEQVTCEDDDFDLSHDAVQHRLMESLGLTRDASYKVLQFNCGGLNEGVYIVKDPVRKFELVLKRVKSHRRREITPTDAESYAWLVEQCPEIVDDDLLAFPRKIITLTSSNGERTFDIIVMRRCPGRSLSEIIAGKLSIGKLDTLLDLFSQVGRCLAELHARYGGWQHGDFTPSNIFHDERLGKTTFIDVGDVGKEQMETDLEHFFLALGILEKAYGNKAVHLTTDCYQAFLAAYEEESRRRRSQNSA